MSSPRIMFLEVTPLVVLKWLCTAALWRRLEHSALIHGTALPEAHTARGKHGKEGRRVVCCSVDFPQATSLLKRHRMDWRGLRVYKTAFYLRTTGLETSLFSSHFYRASQIIPPGPKVHCPGTLPTLLREEALLPVDPSPHTRPLSCLQDTLLERCWKEGTFARSGTA